MDSKMIEWGNQMWQNVQADTVELVRKMEDEIDLRIYRKFHKKEGCEK